MEHFSKSLQLLLNDPSSSEHDKVDTLNQLLSVALKQPGNINTTFFQASLYLACGMDTELSLAKRSIFPSGVFAIDPRERLT